MKITIHGKGHDVQNGGIKKPRSIDQIVRIGMFRRGGLGDGLIQSAFLTAVHRKFPGSAVTGYADGQFYKLIMRHPSCSSVKIVPWTVDLITEVHVRNKLIVEDHQDLWFDVKPIPYMDGRLRGNFVRDGVLNDLANIEDRYYQFNGHEIIDFYRANDCRGQTEMFSKMFEIDASITDAYVPMSNPPKTLCLPERYVTISAGWTDTSRYKGWTATGWGEVSKRLNEDGICPVQIGIDSETRIEGSMSVQNLSLEQQLSVVSGAIAHAGSDGFFCHASSALNVPTIVLWGPTPFEVWGHPGQYDVVSPKAKNVWWTHWHWGWNDECPRIMEAIEAEQVTAALCLAIEEKNNA